jgi:hypothetical protein
MLGIVIIIAVIYGIWFDYLDSLRYSPSPTICNTELCKSKIIPIGDMLGGNRIYQPWNILGHLIPGLFLMFYKPDKIELAIAGVLISTVIMDTPLWGVEVLYFHPDQHLWIKDDVPTDNIWEWIGFYYNPIGTDGVWGASNSFPSSAIIFWSIFARIAAAGLLILFQNKHEENKKENISINRIIMNKLEKYSKKG